MLADIKHFMLNFLFLLSAYYYVGCNLCCLIMANNYALLNVWIYLVFGTVETMLCFCDMKLCFCVV